MKRILNLKTPYFLDLWATKKAETLKVIFVLTDKDINASYFYKRHKYNYT